MKQNLKINQFDPTACRTLRAALDEALAPIAKKFGVKITVGSMKYSADSVRAQLTADVGSAEQARFKLAAPSFGFSVDDYGREFTTPDGRRFKLIGFNTRRSAYPCMVINLVNGKRGFMRLETTRKFVKGGTS